jgi:hypothetical protein
MFISKGSSPLSAEKEQARKRKFATYIGWAHNATDLLHRIKVRAKTTVHCENFLINDGCNGQAVKAVSESLP